MSLLNRQVPVSKVKDELRTAEGGGEKYKGGK
jgi:hypothetical protein